MNFARLMGIVPLGIGLTVLGFLWGSPFGEFGSPPLFFRVFGSFIALGFVMTGGGLLFAKLPNLPIDPEAAANLQRLLQSKSSLREMPGAGGNYTCTNCGNTLGKNADVSPLGDVKCTQCGRWFNIHSSQS